MQGGAAMVEPSRLEAPVDANQEGANMAHGDDDNDGATMAESCGASWQRGDEWHASSHQYGATNWKGATKWPTNWDGASATNWEGVIHGLTNWEGAMKPHRVRMMHNLVVNYGL